MGCALQALHLLTLREVLRTHKHWRIMLKRPMWCAFEAIRVLDTGSASKGEQQHIGMTHMRLSPAQSGKRADVTFFNDSCYDGWLHHGGAETVASMSLYVYAMFVETRCSGDIFDSSLATGTFHFEAHYVKSSGYVQLLLRASRTPYLHGFTVPSRAEDVVTNALTDQAWFRPLRCRDQEYHSETWRPVLPYATCCSRPLLRSGPRLHGNTMPAYSGKRLTAELASVQACRAYEAQLVTLAARAGEKLERSQRVPAITDLSCQRSWFPAGGRTDSMAQRFLLPWLLCAGPHVFRRSHLLGRWRMRKKASVLGYLSPLPSHPAWLALAFVGHVTDDDGERLAIITSGTAETGILSACEAAYSSSSPWVRTSPGFHADQLHADEFVSYVAKERSAHLDLMTEARGRPRPAIFSAGRVRRREGRGAARHTCSCGFRDAARWACR